MTRYGIVPEKIEVIYNPVLDRPDPSAPVPHPWLCDEGAPVIVTAGRLSPVKDHRSMIEALSRLVEQRPARLIILGEGPERAALEGLIKDKSLENRVFLAGYVSRPADWYSHADLFLMASRREGFGIVLVDALSAGLPVVSTDCPGGPAEILANGKYGRLVPVGELDAMVAALDEVLRGERPEPPPESWMEQFDLSYVVSRYDAVFASS